MWLPAPSGVAWSAGIARYGERRQQLKMILRYLLPQFLQLKAEGIQPIEVRTPYKRSRYVISVIPEMQSDWSRTYDKSYRGYTPRASR
jgi:hypothetical protein